MSTKTTKKGTRSLALAIAFAVALSLFGGILFAPKMTYADATTVTWDQSILSTFNKEDTEQSSQGITLNGTTKIYQSIFGTAIEFEEEDSVSFSSSIGDIKSIVITASLMGFSSLDMPNLSEGWEFEGYAFEHQYYTLKWSGTPADNVQLSIGEYAIIHLDSIEFVTVKPHEHKNSLVKVEGVPATCDQPGYETYWICSECNKMFSDAEGKNDISEPVVITGHSLVKTDKVPATCTEDGCEAFWICSKCQRMFSDAEGKNEISNPIVIEATGHNWGPWTVVRPATERQTGVETRVCRNDNSHKETRVIPKLKPAEPTKEVYDKNSLLLSAGMNVSQTGSKITAKWGKVSGATSYDVFVTDGNKYPSKPTMTVKSTKASISKLNGKKLNLKKNFKVYVVAKKDGVKLGNSITTYIAGSKNTKMTNEKVILKSKKKLTLKVGKTSKVKVATVLKNSKKKLIAKVRYESTNKKVATVSSKGVIKAKAKGTCYIYVYGSTGYVAKVKVTVK